MINQIDMAVATKLRQMRIEAAISPAQLAARSGIAIHQYEAGERGHRRFPATELYRLARVLDRPISAFFTDCALASVTGRETVSLYGA